MAIFAVIDKDNKVINRIVADDLATAEEVTKSTCVLCDGKSVIGGTWNGTVFTAPQPYPSWTLVDNVWTAPVAKPSIKENTDYEWDETTKTWNEVEVLGSNAPTA